MRDAAAKATGKTFVWFNYRRCPAVALMHELVQEGRIGEVLHVRGTYLQSWGGPETPMLWRFDKDRAGSGAHGDLNAHIVDMARFVTGQEVTRVHGGIAETFVKERAAADGTKHASTVDDVVVFLARFAGGATASFEASRLAHGHHNRNTLEVNGTKGSVRFDFEDIQGGAGHVPGLQRAREGVFVDQATPGAVDNADTLLGFLQVLAAKDIAGAVG